MKRPWTWIATAVLASAVCLPAAAQEDDLRKEIDELRKGQQEILNQLKKIEGQLQAKPKPTAPKGPNVKDVIFEIGDNPVVGPNSATVTVIELTDYQ